MNAMAESRSLIAEMERLLSDQVNVTCPGCDGWGDPALATSAFNHEPDCVIRRARLFLGKEEA
jgi:hypothetical protein